jgi:hypothetical protein
VLCCAAADPFCHQHTNTTNRYIALITYESCSYKQQQLGRTVVYVFPSDSGVEGGGDDSAMRLRQQQVQL